MKANSRSNVILEAPTVEEAYHAVIGGTSRHKTVIVSGNCWVDFPQSINFKLNSWK